jgi:hypothetical protein
VRAESQSHGKFDLRVEFRLGAACDVNVMQIDLGGLPVVAFSKVRRIE